MKIKKPSCRYDYVMLIDDDELDNFVNQKIIEGNNFAEKVYVSTSGKSAVELLQNLLLISGNTENLLPKVIFIDINMPIMDGFQFIERFELLMSTSADDFKLVILTTSVNEEDRNKTLKLKKNVRFLNKPLTDESLESIE